MKTPPSLLALPLIAFSLLGTANAQTEASGIAAVVNDDVITTGMVAEASRAQFNVWLMENRERRITQARANKQMEEIEAGALQDLIDRQLILDEFQELGGTIKKNHIDNAVDDFIRQRFDGDRSAFLDELKRNGMSMEQFRNAQEESIAVRSLRSQNVDNSAAIFITPQEIEDWYAENQDLFRGEGFVKIRTITMPKTENGVAATAESQRRLVEEVLSKLRDGADFGSMARFYSVDSGRENGGERGTFREADLAGPLGEVAFDIPVGTVSNPIDLGDFYTLLLVEAREPGEVAPLEQVKDEVENYVMQDKRQVKVERWLERLRRDANIRILAQNP